MLNEKNIQVAFQFNASDGSFVPEKIINTMKLSPNDVRVVRQSGSDKMCIDLGYSIDAPPNNLIFKIDSQICLIKTVAQRTDLVNISLTKNEVAIITNDPNFRTLVWTSTSNLDKYLYYEILSLNTGLSSWMFDEMAKKLNALKPDEIESNITDLKGRMQLAENNLDVLDVDLAELEKKVSSLDDRLTDTESKISVAEQNIQAINENIGLLEDSISDLKTKTDTLDTRTAGISRADTTTTVADSLRAGGTLEVIGKSTVKDIEVKGNIEVGADTVITGVLKDSEGFKYEKVKRGTLKNPPAIYSNVDVLVYPENRCIIKGVLTEVNNIEVPAGELSASIPTQIVGKIDSIKSFILTDITGEAKFIASVNGAIAPPFFNLVYRNITAISQKILATKFYFTIDCIKNDMSDINF